MRSSRLMSVAASAALLIGLAGCSQSSGSSGGGASGSASADAGAFPVTIEHAYGETTIEKKPTRVASVAWMNHEVPLALGVVPVGMAKADYGDEDGDGLLPWVKDELDRLGATTPVLFDETDSIDFEAVADTRPDVILAAYSGLSKADYETLSKIAPTVAFPGVAWGTTLEQTIELDSEALGLKAKGKELIASLDGAILSDVEAHPVLAGKTAMFAYFDPSDLGSVGFYTTHDTRPLFLEQLGMTTPKAVADASTKSGEFFTTVSAENAGSFDDVDVIVTYGDAAFLKKLQADPLIGRIPAIRNGAVALLGDDTALAASANPSPLSVTGSLPDYLGLLDAAASAAS